jgi:hypothetical protein
MWRTFFNWDDYLFWFACDSNGWGNMLAVEMYGQVTIGLASGEISSQ